MFGEAERVFDIHGQISYRASNLCAIEKQLNGAQVARRLVDDRRFRAPERVRAVILTS